MPVPDTWTSVDIGDGWTPLSMNVTLKYTKLSCGIAPTLGQNCSSLAAVSQTDVLRVLKEERLVVIDTRDSKAYAAALVLAAGRAHLDNIRCLLGRGVSVDAVNFEGSTALHAAATVGRFAVELLLNTGATVNKLDRNRWTPLMLTAREGHPTIVKLLLTCAVWSSGDRAGAPQCGGECGFGRQWRDGTTHVCSNVIGSWGTIVDAPNRTRGYTALSTAALYGRIEVVLLLLSNGANVKAQNSIGDTPLLLAATQGRLEAVRELLDNGASPTTSNAMGETPLSRAVDGGHVEVAAMLWIAAGSRSRLPATNFEIQKAP